MNPRCAKFLFIITLLISTNANAQWGIENSLGFGWGMNKTSFGDKRNIIPGDSIIKPISFSMGNGNRIGFNMVKNEDSTLLQYVVGLSYLFNNNSEVLSYTDTIKRFETSKGFHCPQLRLTLMAGANSKNWFARAGLIVPLISNFTETSFLKDSNFIMKTKGNVKLHSSIGLRAETGITYKIKSGFNIKLTCFAEALNINRKKLTLTSYSDTRNDNLENVFKTLSERETNYFKEPFAGMNNSKINPNGFNKNKALDELSKPVSFSAFGISISLVYLF